MEKPIAESQALEAEKKLNSQFYVLTPDGTLTPAASFDYAQHPNFKKFVDYEMAKKREVTREPAHVALMRRLEIADYEAGSDPGNVRWFPKGKLMKDVLEDKVTNAILRYGGMPVETPIMYDYEHPALKKYLNRFPARQYVLRSDDKEFFLRFAACFGMFLTLSRCPITYRQLPLRMFELTRYSFRREKSGELVGLRRLRTFTMPDMHTLCADMQQAQGEYERQFALCMQWMAELAVPYETAFRCLRSLYESDGALVHSLAQKLQKPVLLELFEERYAYFVLKFEFNFVDTTGKAAALSTNQIDVENADTYDISYVAQDGKKHRPLILHLSVSGAIERNVYALLENEAMRAERGETPALPLWLSPVQVRLLPVADRHVGHAEGMALALQAAGVRVELDDRSESVGRKIRDAGTEWIPFVAVIGDREVEAKRISVTERGSKEQKQMAAEELAALVKSRSAGISKASYLPLRLSQRPVFA
jgi:threonyl-tRNA synthetase